MRLMFVIKSLSVAGGGAERVLIDVASALATRGHAVAIATFDSAGSQSFYPASSALEIMPLAIGDSGAETGAGEFIGRVRALRRLSQRMRPDVAIGFMHSAYVALGLALAGSGVPVIGSEHTVFVHFRGRRLQSLALRLSAPLLRTMTVVSEHARVTFPRALQRKMTVIPNSVAVPSKSADVVGGSRKILLSVGRLDAEKDQATLIAAFGRIAGQFPEWKLRILGEGSLREELEAQARTLGLRERIELPGAARDIGAEYSAAQLFALPSLYESFGLATAEALRHGLPAVGFAECPGTNELIQDGVNGLLAAGVGSPESLAKALARLMSSEDLRTRMGRAAPQTVAQFSLEGIVDRWERLLHQTARATALDRTQP